MFIPNSSQIPSLSCTSFASFLPSPSRPVMQTIYSSMCGLALGNDLITKGYTLRENSVPTPRGKQLPVASQPCVGFYVNLPSPAWIWSVLNFQFLCVLLPTLCVPMCCCLAMSRRHCFTGVTDLLWILVFLILCCNDP